LIFLSNLNYISPQNVTFWFKGTLKKKAFELGCVPAVSTGFWGGARHLCQFLGEGYINKFAKAWKTEQPGKLCDKQNELLPN